MWFNQFVIPVVTYIVTLCGRNDPRTVTARRISGRVGWVVSWYIGSHSISLSSSSNSITIQKSRKKFLQKFSPKFLQNAKARENGPFWRFIPHDIVRQP